MIGIRDCTRALINLQLNEYSDADIKQKQEELSALYDGYTAKFGILNSRANRIAFDQDSSYSLICSLENLDEEGNFKEKAAIFQKRTIKQEKVVTSVDTASEALTVSLSEKAVVDLPYMSELSGKDTKEIVEELRGVIFEDPITGKWETADEYLSGNVREKLKIATSYAETKPEFSINVQALKQIQPQNLDASEIEIRIGATWIDPKYIDDFMGEVFQTPHYLLDPGAVKTSFSNITSTWNIAGKNAETSRSFANTTFGTTRVKALATGNPYIKEKMDLDIQVSRLRLLKANYTSQKYRMEDNIVQHYPRQIVMVKELIEKLEQDIALYEQNAATSKDKFHMQVGSGVYDTRKDAGNAIIKFFQTDADGTAKIGTYLGFSMNIAFDSFNRKFVLRLKGAMNHPVEIGPDPVGNIIRLDNVLKTMPDKLAEAKDRLETLTNQLESAKIEVTKPFQQEEELAEKLKRLAELNALLNMDEKGTDALILEDDEQPAIVNSDMAVTPITSVKTKPMLKKKVVGLCL